MLTIVVPIFNGIACGIITKLVRNYTHRYFKIVPSLVGATIGVLLIWVAIPLWTSLTMPPLFIPYNPLQVALHVFCQTGVQYIIAKLEKKE